MDLLSKNTNEETKLTQKNNLGISDGGRYFGTGIKTSLHGTLYQLKILMYFLIRGLVNNYNFYLATEMEAGEKFDDVVFKYENESKTGTVFRFLQAKHKQDESKVITASDLLKDSDDNFTIKKYFNSYLKIIKNKEFAGDNVEFMDFIIYTNIDLHEDIKTGFKDVDSADDILSKIQRIDEKFLFDAKSIKYKSPKLLKIDRNNFPSKDKLEAVLKKSCDYYKLSTCLAKILASGNKQWPKEDLFKTYIEWLRENIIDINKDGNKNFIQFKEDFISGKENLIFRENVEKVYKDEIKNKLSNDFLQKLKDAKYELPKQFAISNKCDNYVAPVMATDCDIQNFIDKLVFAVNQPNEIQLGKIIEAEISIYLGLKNCELVASNFLQEILDWIKEKEGRFITSEFDERLKQMKHKLVSYGIFGITLMNKNTIDRYDCKFKDDNVTEAIDDFFYRNIDRKILTIFDEAPLITKIKLLQVKKNARLDEDILSNLKFLRDQMGSDLCALKPFSSEACDHLTIIITDESELDQKAIGLLKHFIIITNQVPNKKIMMIVLLNIKDLFESILNNLFQEIGTDIERKYINLINTNNSLLDLTCDSQKKVLEECQVTFQGKDVKWSEVLLDDSKQTLCGSMLATLIQKEKLDIGDNYENFKKYLLDASLHRHVKAKKIATNHQNDIYQYLTTIEQAHEELKKFERENRHRVADVRERAAKEVNRTVKKIKKIRF